jgi:hypothetical protein
VGAGSGAVRRHCGLVSDQRWLSALPVKNDKYMLWAHMERPPPPLAATRNRP